VHALIFGNRKVVAYGGVRRGKDYESFAAEHADCEILTTNEYIKSKQIAHSIMQCAPARALLEGVVETTLLFNWMGVACRATPDVRGASFVTELKTCGISDPAKFQWHALRMHYHGQLAFQRLACLANGHPVQDAYIVAVESVAPYPVVVYRVGDRTLAVGDKLLHLWMERLKSCEAAQYWPGYVETIVELDVPEEIDFDLEEILVD
jgi:hypothetical protein